MIILQKVPNDQHLHPKRPSKSLKFGFMAERGREGERKGGWEDLLARAVNYREQLETHVGT